MDITKDEDEKEDVEMIKESKEQSNGNAENGTELGVEADEEAGDNYEEVDDALLDTPDSEPGEEDM